MKAIVFADRLGQELAPLNERNCVALLPVASKPLINYTFEALLAAGVREVIIVISPFAPLMRKNMGNGERWGITLQYLVSQGEESPAAVLARQGALLSEHCYLMVRGDMLHSLPLQSFIKQAEQLAGDCVAATVAKGFTGIAVVQRRETENPWAAADVLTWQPTAWQHNTEMALTVELSGHYALIDSLHNYHQTNLKAVEGFYHELVLPGTEVHEGLYIGHRSNVVLNNRGIIGMFCRVHPTARLSGGVVICNEAIIDSEARLYNTVVMPNTYVGQGLELQNTIAWGNVLIQFKPNEKTADIRGIDSFFIADLHRENLNVLLANQFNRVLGMLLLILSMPLWAIAAAVVFAQRSGEPLRQVILVGNRHRMDAQGNFSAQPFTALEWNTKSPILRHLPKLWAVFQGHIRMVGVAPHSPMQLAQRSAPWEFLRDQAPVGLWGPHQLDFRPVSAQVSSIEHAIEEAHYAVQRSFYRDLLWLGRGILSVFNPRAWW